MRRNFRHLEEEIIILNNYYECTCIDYEQKVDVLCLYFHMEMKVHVFVEVCGILEVV